MKILIVDGQGGGLGRVLVERITSELPMASLTVVGTNVLATSAMIKAGATVGATGENAVVYNCKYADVIVGALGIGFANSMHGEISPTMARAVSESDAVKLLIPMSKCSVAVIGAVEKPIGAYVSETIERLRALQESRR